MYNILVVDDDKEIVESIEIYLRNEGYKVFKAYDGLEALDILTNEEIHLILMDIMMPKLDGIKATIKIRQEKNIPIILVSAKGEDTDKILGLNIGADDYITKPFNPLEVTARVKTVLRRCRRGAETNDEMDIRGLTINRASRRCSLFGRELALTPTEFDILWYLCDNAGRVVASEELFEAVWKEKFLTSSSNTVMAHIGRLREKMHEPARKPKFIKTVWGVGYEIEK